MVREREDGFDVNGCYTLDGLCYCAAHGRDLPGAERMLACSESGCPLFGNYHAAGRLFCLAHGRPHGAVPNPAHRCAHLHADGTQCQRMVSTDPTPGLERLCGIHAASLYGFFEHAVFAALALGVARGSLTGLGEVERQARLQTASELRLDGLMADASLGGSVHIEIDEGTHAAKAADNAARQAIIALDQPRSTTLPPLRAALRLWVNAIPELVAIRAAFDEAARRGGGAPEHMRALTRERGDATVAAATAADGFAPFGTAEAAAHGSPIGYWLACHASAGTTTAGAHLHRLADVVLPALVAAVRDHAAATATARSFPLVLAGHPEAVVAQYAPVIPGLVVVDAFAVLLLQRDFFPRWKIISAAIFSEVKAALLAGSRTVHTHYSFAAAQPRPPVSR